MSGEWCHGCDLPEDECTCTRVAPHHRAPSGVDEDRVLVFGYTNAKGVTESRRVIPARWYFGTWLPYYRSPRWLMEGADLGRDGARRCFDVAKMVRS